MDIKENPVKILIIGEKGNLGQELVNLFLKDKKYQVFGWDKGEIDITDREKAQEKIIELAPKIIINTAAYNAVDQCEEVNGFEAAKKINGEAVGFLAQASKKAGAIFVHYSTGYVFDGVKKEGYKESDKPNPISRYGESKYLGEKYLQESGSDYYLIRTSRIFGKKGSSEMSKESFVDIMLQLGHKKDLLELVDEEIDNFTYAPDLAKATKDLIESGMLFGIYHITNKGAYSWYAAAIKVFNEAGIKVKVVPVSSQIFPRPAKRPEYSALLNTKLPSLRSFEEAVREYLAEKKI